MVNERNLKSVPNSKAVFCKNRPKRRGVQIGVEKTAKEGATTILSARRSKRGSAKKWTKNRVQVGRKISEGNACENSHKRLIARRFVDRLILDEQNLWRLLAPRVLLGKFAAMVTNGCVQTGNKSGLKSDALCCLIFWGFVVSE